MPTTQAQTEDEDIIILGDDTSETENEAITFDQTEEKKEETINETNTAEETKDSLVFDNKEANEIEIDEKPVEEMKEKNEGDSVFDFLGGDEAKEKIPETKEINPLDMQTEDKKEENLQEQDSDTIDFLWDVKEEKEDIVLEDSSKDDSVLDTFAVGGTQSSWAQDDTSGDMNTILEETIQKLKARQEVISSSKGEKNSEVDERNEKIKNLRNEVTELKKEIKDLETEDEKIQANVESLEKMKIGATTTSWAKRTPRRKAA